MYCGTWTYPLLDYRQKSSCISPGNCDEEAFFGGGLVSPKHPQLWDRAAWAWLGLSKKRFVYLYEFCPPPKTSGWRKKCSWQTSRQNCIQSTTVCSDIMSSSCRIFSWEGPRDLPGMVLHMYMRPKICHFSNFDFSKKLPFRKLYWLLQTVHRHDIPSILLPSLTTYSCLTADSGKGKCHCFSVCFF